MNYSRKISKSEFNYRLSVIVNELKLENWTVVPVREYFNLHSLKVGSFYEVIFEVTSYDPFNVWTYIVVYSGPIEYIIKDFFSFRKNHAKGPYVRRTFIESVRLDNVILPASLAQANDNSREFFDFVLPIWKSQWEELQTKLKSFENLEELYNIVVASRKVGRDKMTYAGILLLGKLVSEECFEKELQFLEPIIYDNDQNEISQEISDCTIKLIVFLKTFDAKKYLSDRPWESVTEDTLPEPQVKEEADPIYLENTGIIAISKDYSGNKLNTLAKLLGGKILRESASCEAGDMARMSYDPAEQVDILQLAPSTLIFVHNPAILNRFDIKKASANGEALVVMTELATTNSVMISYYRNGKPVYQHMSNDGVIIENESGDGFERGDTDVSVFIEQLFEQVTGRRHQDIRSDEEGSTYIF